MHIVYTFPSFLGKNKEICICRGFKKKKKKWYWSKLMLNLKICISCNIDTLFIKAQQLWRNSICVNIAWLSGLTFFYVLWKLWPCFSWECNFFNYIATFVVWILKKKWKILWRFACWLGPLSENSTTNHLFSYIAAFHTWTWSFWHTSQYIWIMFSLKNFKICTFKKISKSHI